MMIVWKQKQWIDNVITKKTSHRLGFIRIKIQNKIESKQKERSHYQKVKFEKISRINPEYKVHTRIQN